MKYGAYKPSLKLERHERHERWAVGPADVVAVAARCTGTGPVDSMGYSSCLRGKSDPAVGHMGKLIKEVVAYMALR